MTWTRFSDMHSGGYPKERWTKIYIEAGEDLAVTIFQNVVGRNPNNITYNCCGNDYIISEEDSLESASGYDRGCAYSVEVHDYIEEPSGESWKSYITLEDYIKRDDVLIIRKEDF